MSAPLHIFWDNSNIYHPAKYVAEKRHGFSSFNHVRLQFDHLYDLARAGREVTSAFCVGSVPPGLEAVWDRIRELGVSVELFERGRRSGKEQAVDQALQVHMLRVGMDSPPGVAVLLTGDGAGYLDGVGFHADLERLHRSGWAVEVLSWNSSVNRYLRRWAEENGVYVALDDFFESITFEEGGRQSVPLSLARRRVAARA